MKKILDRIAQFMIEETIWIYAAVILAFSTMVTKEISGKWGDFFYLLLFTTICFLPVLIFSWSLNRRLAKVSSVKLYTWFGVAFVVVPFLLYLLKIEKLLTSIDWHNFYIGVVAGVLLLMALLIRINDVVLQKTMGRVWFKEIHLERIIFIGMILLSFVAVISSNVFQEWYPGFSPVAKALPTMLFYMVQFFLILLVYYFFYWINHYLLMNRVFKKKGVIYYGVGFVAVLYLFFPLAGLLISFIPIATVFQAHPAYYESNFADVNLMTPMFGMLITIPFIVMYQWFRQQGQILSLEKEKSNTELNLLKQQINPHFFFNTLNNLYAMSINQNKDTPEVILQLSELMRYVIYKGKESTVPLIEEINYVKDYIRLQQIRLHKKLDFQFDEQIEDEQLRIPPLLLITFVENAFKHGIEPAEKDCFLHLSIKVIDGEITFTCTNSIEEKNTEAPGIGLDNLRKRLALRFPDRHELQFEDNENDYFASLKIQLQ